MSLIDLVARTASRDELVELLRGTEEQRQQLAARNETLRAALPNVEMSNAALPDSQKPDARS
jgi:hypothetical protein